MASRTHGGTPGLFSRQPMLFVVVACLLVATYFLLSSSTASSLAEVDELRTALWVIRNEVIALRQENARSTPPDGLCDVKEQLNSVQSTVKDLQEKIREDATQTRSSFIHTDALVQALMRVTFAEKRKNRFAIVTLVANDAANRYTKLTPDILKNRQLYATKHGYSVEFRTKGMSPRLPQWSKVLFIREVLPFYDWVLWVDADAILMNGATDLESLVDEGFDMIVSKGSQTELNSGIFLMRNSPWSFGFLDQVWQVDKFEDHLWAEQLGIQEVLSKNPKNKDHIKYLSPRALNSRPGGEGKPSDHNTFEDGDFIVHLAGQFWENKGKAEQLFMEWIRRSTLHTEEVVEHGD